MERILVTGGAGFIGSHLAERLAEAHEVTVLDDLSSGRKENVPAGVRLVEGSILAPPEMGEFDSVFHFAAEPDVRAPPERIFELNVLGTGKVLEFCGEWGAKRIVFASSSTVYGEAEVPTPENAPLNPISAYGASKAAGEAHLSSFAHSHGGRVVSLRYANIFGPRSLRGVMRDFFFKLRGEHRRLEILGDGKQDKSYLYISDAVDATLLAWEKSSGPFEAFNVGNEEKTDVDSIAKLVCSNLSLSPKFEYSGGERGWEGDVPLMLLDVSKMKALGWAQKTPLEKGLGEYLQWLGGCNSS